MQLLLATQHLGMSLISAKTNLLVSLTNRIFGLTVINNQLVIIDFTYFPTSALTLALAVLTMYEKSDAKGAKHSWTSTS